MTGQQQRQVAALVREARRWLVLRQYLPGERILASHSKTGGVRLYYARRRRTGHTNTPKRHANLGT